MQSHSEELSEFIFKIHLSVCRRIVSNSVLSTLKKTHFLVYLQACAQLWCRFWKRVYLEAGANKRSVTDAVWSCCCELVSNAEKGRRRWCWRWSQKRYFSSYWDIFAKKNKRTDFILVSCVITFFFLIPLKTLTSFPKY